MGKTVAIKTDPWLGVSQRGLGRTAALTCFVAAFLSASGAFDTDKAAIVPRTGYWLVISLVAMVSLEASHRWLSRRTVPQPEWQLRAKGLALLFLPLTVLALLLCKALFGGPLSLDRFAALLPGMTGIVAAIQLLLSLLTQQAAGADGPAAEPSGRNDALVDALPLPLRRARILAVRAEDHYVRVYTSAGEALVRMRFRDAVSALAGHAGRLPHRSWWVADDSVVALSRVGRKTFLTLLSGHRIPVTRKAAAALGPEFSLREAADLAPAPTH